LKYASKVSDIFGAPVLRKAEAVSMMGCMLSKLELSKATEAATVQQVGHGLLWRGTLGTRILEAWGKSGMNLGRTTTD